MATAWDASDYPDDRSWVHGLTHQMRDEIITAMHAAKTQGIAAKDITAENFYKGLRMDSIFSKQFLTG